MKIRFQYLIRAGSIDFVLICMCLGCAGLEKQYSEFQSAINETRSAIREQLNFDKPESSVEPVNDKVSGDSGDFDQAPQHSAREVHKDFYKHTVRWSGESLSLIAKWYTGAHKNWRKLAQANPRIEPNLIKPGYIILIPPALLKTRKPLPQKVAARYTPHYFVHTVRYDGEKIKDIAGWYTGDSNNWRLLVKANPNINAERLAAGNEIFIPQHILKTRKPIPQPKPSSSASKPDTRPGTAEPKIVPAVEEKIKLFGPKQFPSS